MLVQSVEIDALILHGEMQSGIMRVFYLHIAELYNNIPLRKTFTIKCGGKLKKQSAVL